MTPTDDLVVPDRPWTLRRIASGVGRRIPLRPLRVFFPFKIWRALLRLWLGAIRAQPDKRLAMRQLLMLDADLRLAVDGGATAYDHGVHAKHRLMRYHDFFVERIGRDERVLDVGCGKGELAHDVAERSGATVIAIDVSPWALAFARQRFSHPRVTHVQANVLDYQPDEPIDVAILSNVLEHIAPRTQLLTTLRTRDGAKRLLVRVPILERDWTVPLREELGLPHFSDPGHEVEYDPEQLRTELAASGWQMGQPKSVWGEIWVEATAGPNDAGPTNR